MATQIIPDPQTETYASVPGKIPVMESFATLQGEGRFTGHAAWFIRLAGCVVGCSWCDVKDSWTIDDSQFRNVQDIVGDAVKNTARLAVITGGEPCMHDLKELTSALQAKGFRTHLETSGSWKISGSFDWICVSPKKFRKPLIETMNKADELKVIVYHPSDLEWGVQQAMLVKPGCMLYFQPEFGKMKEMLPKIVEFIGQHPEWNLSLQTHKFIGIP